MVDGSGCGGGGPVEAKGVWADGVEPGDDSADDFGLLLSRI